MGLQRASLIQQMGQHQLFGQAGERGSGFVHGKRQSASGDPAL
jgi:hypothetical protein